MAMQIKDPAGLLPGRPPDWVGGWGGPVFWDATWMVDDGGPRKTKGSSTATTLTLPCGVMWGGYQAQGHFVQPNRSPV